MNVVYSKDLGCHPLAKVATRLQDITPLAAGEAGLLPAAEYP